MKKTQNNWPDPISICLAELSGDDLILTPNRRLAAWLKRDHEKLMVTQRRLAWQPLNAQPIDSWLMDLFERLVLSGGLQHETPKLLTSNQSALLWKRLIADVLSNPFDLDGLAALCIQARSLVCRWGVPDEECHTLETDENRLFSECHLEYKRQLEANHWIDSAGLASFLMAHVPAELLPNANVYLHGFNDLNEPQLLNAADWFQSMGNEVSFTHQTQHPSQANTVKFSSKSLQFSAAMRWAIQEIKNNAVNRVCVVVPGLEQQRSHMIRACKDIQALNPEYFDSNWESIINITAGMPLTKYALVSHALLLMRAFVGALSLQEWGVLLKSPYFSDGEKCFLEMDQFESHLRSCKKKELRLSNVIESWKIFSEKRNFQSIEFTLANVAGLNGGNGKKSTRAWWAWLHHLLKSVGWAEGRTLSSYEYQIHQRFMEVLSQVNELDELAGAITLSEFVREITTLLKNTPFQPQTEMAPIQVMGVLEAAGINFDAIWVCECESSQWPQSVNSNPCLPKSVLKKYGMPGSGPERELHYANAMLGGFESAAPTVFFSWGEYDGDVQNLLTPMLQHIPPINQINESLISTTREQQQLSLRACIQISDEDFMGAPFIEKEVKGGASLIRAQSLCPFKAFATYRLDIKESDQVEEGVAASDRGSLVHSVMEAFWHEVENSENLKHLLENPKQLAQVIDDIVDKEMLLFKKNVYLHPQSLYQLEKERTLDTVMQWVTSQESRREAFSVKHLEKSETLTLSDLTFTLKTDRVDVLADGSQVVVDYKTGLKNANSLEGDRPDEPQMPLYALLDSEHVKALLFGVLSPSKQDWVGRWDAEKPLFLDAKSNRQNESVEWSERIESWKITIDRIVNEFKQGHAKVDPKDATTCQYCHLSPVCRIKEVVQDAE